MAVCENCGGEIIFRYVDGLNTPIHLSGGCRNGTASHGDYITPPTITRTQSKRPERNSDGWRRGASRSDCTEPLTHPTRCPICGDFIFFHTNGNGDAVFFDPPLGPPWPKHACLAMEQTRIVASTSHSLMDIVRLTKRPSSISPPTAIPGSGGGTQAKKSASSQAEADIHEALQFGVVLSTKKAVVYIGLPNSYIRKRVEGHRVQICDSTGQTLRIFVAVAFEPSPCAGQLVRFSLQKEIQDGKECLSAATFETCKLADAQCAVGSLKMRHWWIDPGKILGGSNPSPECTPRRYWPDHSSGQNLTSRRALVCA